MSAPAKNHLITSLTGHLLLGKPISLPTGGHGVFHSADKTRKPLIQPTIYRNLSIRQANVERVFNAVASGLETAMDIAISTNLSISTVNKALHDLEDWPDGARIARTSSATQKHRFRVLNNSLPTNGK